MGKIILKSHIKNDEYTDYVYNVFDITKLSLLNWMIDVDNLACFV